MYHLHLWHRPSLSYRRVASYATLSDLCERSDWKPSPVYEVSAICTDDTGKIVWQGTGGTQREE